MSNRPCSHFRNVLVHFGGPWARNALQTGIVASKVHGALWYNAHGAAYGYFEVGSSKFVHRYTEKMVISVFFHIPPLRDTTFYLSALSARSLIFLCFPSILA
jgi:hypothetical protein